MKRNEVVEHARGEYQQMGYVHHCLLVVLVFSPAIKIINSPSFNDGEFHRSIEWVDGIGQSRVQLVAADCSEVGHDERAKAVEHLREVHAPYPFSDIAQCSPPKEHFFWGDEEEEEEEEGCDVCIGMGRRCD
jgi:hypothetical protein